MALERRTSMGSLSPWRVRMSAMRSMVALNQMASPAGGAGDDHFQPVFARPAEPHKPFLGS